MQNQLRDSFMVELLKGKAGLSVAEIVYMIKPIREAYAKLGNLVYAGSKKAKAKYYPEKNPEWIKMTLVDKTRYLIISICATDYIIIDLETKTSITEFSKIEPLFNKEAWFAQVKEAARIHKNLVNFFDFSAKYVDILQAFYILKSKEFAIPSTIYYDVDMFKYAAGLCINLHDTYTVLSFYSLDDQKRFLNDIFILGNDLNKWMYPNVFTGMMPEKEKEIAKNTKNIIVPHEFIPKEFLEYFRISFSSTTKHMLIKNSPKF